MGDTTSDNIDAGLALYRCGESAAALRAFGESSAPLRSDLALIWAALLAHDGDPEQACRILYQASRADDDDEAQICRLFADMLMVTHGGRALEDLEMVARGRLARLFYYLVVLPPKSVLGLGARLAPKSAHAARLKKLRASLLARYWINGLPVLPDYMSRARSLYSLAGHAESGDAYRRVFDGYLDYWVGQGLMLPDFLLACIKPADAHALYALLRVRSPAAILEIGTFIGFSSCLMAAALRANGHGHIHCVDPDQRHLSVDQPLAHARYMLQRLDFARVVTLHRGYFSAPPSPACNVPLLGPDASSLLPPIEFVFIDGDHSSAAVVRDFALLLPCLAPAATVVFHDVNTWLSVRQGIDEIMRGDLIRSWSVDCYPITPTGLDGLLVLDLRARR